MAETRFIRTVTFGGYDKGEVDKKLEYLYTQVYDLKNELRETKLTLKEYEKGTEQEKAAESVLAGERAKLTQVQVQNETMTDKLKSAEEESKAKTQEIEELKAKLAETQKQLEEVSGKLKAAESGGSAEALSAVFIEAQKSANSLVENAKKEAEKITAESQQAAEDTVTGANNTAKKVIFEAEKRAALVEADAANKSEQMTVASGNLRAVMVKDVEEMSVELKKLRAVFEEFEKLGIARLDESEKLLQKTDSKLKANGVPVFRNPEIIEPMMPEEPEYEAMSSKKKQHSELEKLAEMASSIGGKGDKAESKPAEPASAKKDGGVDLAELMKQAEALNKK